MPEVESVRIKCFSSMINKELSFLLPRTFIFDGILYLITLPFFGFRLDMLLGMLLGTFVMLLNFVILGISSEHAVERSVRGAKTLMTFSYIGRFAIMGCLFAFCVITGYANVVMAAIPTMYPRWSYTLDAAVKKRKEGKDL